MFNTTDLHDGLVITTGLPEPYEFALVIKVRDYETDSQGIVNNANYLHYMEMTRHAFCEYRGFSFGEMSSRGIVAVMRRAEIDYISSLHGAELFVSCLWVERKGPRFIFHQDLFHAENGQPVVRAQATVVATHDGHPTKGDELANRLGVE